MEPVSTALQRGSIETKDNNKALVDGLDNDAVPLASHPNM
jgi:hypothetical protein